jgi:hypothetical protein
MWWWFVLLKFDGVGTVWDRSGYWEDYMRTTLIIPPFQLISEGNAKLASVPSGGGGGGAAASASAPAAGGGAAAAEEKVEEKVEEKEESDDDMVGSTLMNVNVIADRYCRASACSIKESVVCGWSWTP